MTLAELIAPLVQSGDVIEQHGDLSVNLDALTDNSRQVTPGSAFVAVKGERVDGHNFLQQALLARASAVIVQDHIASADMAISSVRLRNCRSVLGILAARLHENPSTRLRMVGVTGTNGKTTVTYLCKAILEAAGRKVGLIGTVAYHIGSERLDASHTTPGAVELQALLSRMVAADVEAAVMEVSSHALAMDRTAGCEFDVAVFTNLTQDHLDFHSTLEDYFEAKLRLFTALSPAGSKHSPKRAIVNVDDPRGSRVVQSCRVPVWTYALRTPADIRAENVRLSLSGTRFVAATPLGRVEVESRLVGEHNVANLLAAIGVGLNEGLATQTIAEGIRRLADVPGRFERVEAGQDFTVVVDYAHTDDALIRLLSAAETLKTGRIITVFGCGGDRDRGKRPKMGRAAVKRSDVVILTSDNPRTEDPVAILREVEAGAREALEPGRGRYEVIVDRRAAIEAAIEEAKPGDMVLIAGKGHEDYQIVGTHRLHFDDREVAREAIRRLAR